MRKINFIFLEFILVVVLLFVASVMRVHACFLGFGSDCVSANTETQTVYNNQQRMETAVPIPQLNDSLERLNISKRLQLFSNPSKVSYIYLVSFGKVMAFYTVKGKITSGLKRLTNPNNIVDSCGHILQPGVDEPCGTNPGSVITAPELDGTYGTSDNYIYFWDTSGVYHQWNGEYLLVDQPQQLATPPDLVQQVK